MLGHLLRGRSPTSFDRVLGLRFGAAAVRRLAAGYNGVIVSLNLQGRAVFERQG